MEMLLKWYLNPLPHIKWKLLTSIFITWLQHPAAADCVLLSLPASARDMEGDALIQMSL